jgi:mannosyltransferase OCH1-like enzyme
MKSDLLRFIYLYYKGGVYFDIDYEFNETCLNFISEIYRSDYDVIIGEQQDQSD